MRYMKMMVCTVLIFLLTTGTVFATAESNPIEPNWIEGGTTVNVGDISTLELDESLLYLDREDTMDVQEYLGNNVMGTEMGSVFPVNEEESWFVLFEYEDVGYISDKDKNKINAKKLLKSYQEGTDASNETRAEEERLFVKGWHTEPYYNEEDRTLIWALLAEDFYGNAIINYNVRILTRGGYVSVLLVTDEATLDREIATLNKLILPKYSITAGSTYEDFDPSVDKKSEVGLTGLILGGAGLVAAKKAGLIGAALVLLKKFWFVLLAVPLAIWRWIKGRSGRRQEEEQQEQSYVNPYGTDNSSSDQTINNDPK